MLMINLIRLNPRRLMPLLSMQPLLFDAMHQMNLFLPPLLRREDITSHELADASFFYSSAIHHLSPRGNKKMAGASLQLQPRRVENALYSRAKNHNSVFYTNHDFFFSFFSTDVSTHFFRRPFFFFLPFFSPLLLTSGLINVLGRMRMDIPKREICENLEALSLSLSRWKLMDLNERLGRPAAPARCDTTKRW